MIVAFVTAALLLPPASQEGSYRLPPQAVVDIVDAEPAPGVAFSPDGRWMLLSERDAMPSIEEVSRRMLRLAGMRIDPAARGPFRTRYVQGLRLRDLRGGGERTLELPDGARVASTRWSHDSRHLLYQLVDDGGAELWIVALAAGTPPRRLSEDLDTVLLQPRFSPDGEHVLYATLAGGQEPPPPAAPSGPNVRETSGARTPLRTYQDLLSNPYEEALFEHYAKTRMWVSTLDGERAWSRGPAMYADASFSPDGGWLLTTTLHRPFSYTMPWSRFPRRVEALHLEDGEPTETTHVVADLPLAEGVPIGGVPTGPRNVGWKAGEPATLVWAEALDGGDPGREVEHRDVWLAQAAPFEEAPRELVRVAERATRVSWLADPGRMITGEYDRDRRWTRTLLHDLARGGDPVVLEDRSIRDRYGDPGALQTTYDRRGSRIVLQDGPWIYRAGRGASPEGLYPFLDRQNLASLATERLWRCSGESYEVVVDVHAGANQGEPDFVTSRETPTSPANYFLHAGDSVVALTEFPDPTPQIRGIEKELVRYERADGVPLSATLYLPADYEEGTRLPLFVWAYPIEFNDPRTAGQVSTSAYRFTRIAGLSHLTLVTQGYAVMDGATMPVIGDAETMNDTFVEQIVAAAQAAIDFVVERGVADRDRVGVGGHSYGAFMTANLLAHCDLFKAGIARSGAYNRSLTPFGFQSERRTIWEAPETYFAVSPFFHADQLKEPLLLIHGEADNNSGTFPMQSERLFQALQGNGGTARLVMLPNESHGYRARESVLHVQAEMIDWLDQYVKGAGAVEASASSAER